MLAGRSPGGDALWPVLAPVAVGRSPIRHQTPPRTINQSINQTNNQTNNQSIREKRLK
jgi:hypothetical protein